MEIAKNPGAWRVEQYRDGDDVRVLSVEPSKVKDAPQDSVTLRSIPAILDEGDLTTQTLYEEVVVPDAKMDPQLKKLADKTREPWPGSEVRTLASQGPVENRINLTIVGDGYTEAEKARFFEDAQRMTDDLFKENTFKSYLPLFNVHAVFVPSNESGISDGDSKDTALGLERWPSGSKRAIMPGNYSAIERALDLSPATDYPILMANDDYYGGLGGRYAITTRSPQSGSMVLRHELGHNFGNVGEEYDGGSAYMGANFSRNGNNPRWRPWIEGEPRAYQGRALFGEYPWQNLQDGPLTYDFNVPRSEQPQPVRFDISSVGWETPQDVAILLDGQPVEAQGVFTDDRSFFRFERNDLTPGRHRLEIREEVHDGDNVLALARAAAYEPGYDTTPDKIQAFPNFDDDGDHVGYRPTHESCLMRDMRTLKFCSVDQENMWHQFLNRVSLIDGVDVTYSPDPSPGPRQRTVSLRTPALEGINVQWFKIEADGSETELEDLRGQTRWTPPSDAEGRYAVSARFETPEVRTYSERFQGRQEFRL
jgi:hypothetical protein